ncbi:Magnetite biomineralization protein Mms6 [uncultured Gammaproteobacteria bacterium]
MVAVVTGPVVGGGKSLGAVGIGHEVVRDTLIAKGVAPAQAAMFPGIEHEVVRDALAAKAVGGTAGVAGKGVAVVGKAGLTAGGSPATAYALNAGGTIWSGKGISLGLGLGLGMWGPILLGVAGVVAFSAYMRYRSQTESAVVDVAEANTDEGFLATQG